MKPRRGFLPPVESSRHSNRFPQIASAIPKKGLTLWRRVGLIAIVFYSERVGPLEDGLLIATQGELAEAREGIQIIQAGGHAANDCWQGQLWLFLLTGWKTKHSIFP